ncbi:MAG: nuclear transport factor 2 family protein [Bryobacteraceae bacterium]|nr:nuclear transport factor 2 family protein [Bryobacteraceae bacterium]
MKSLFLTLALVATLAAQMTPDQKAVLTNVESLAAAIQKGDGATIASLMAEDLMYSHSNAKLENKAEAVAAMVKAKNRLVYEPAPTITIHGTTATVRGFVTTTSMTDGKPVTLKLNILQVWSKIGPKWLLVARQATRLIPQ